MMMYEAMTVMLQIMMMVKGMFFMMTVMMVMIYFWYISNIFPLCTLPSAPKVFKCEKERKCKLTFIKVSEPAQMSVYLLIIIFT